MSNAPKHDPDDPERESDVFTFEGHPIENSTPEQLKVERQRKSDRKGRRDGRR